MKDFNNNLKRDTKRVQDSVEELKNEGDSDAALNYLYFLRDEINKHIKAELKTRKN